MAKKIQGGQLVFTVSDDGSLKLLEQKTKKAAKSMDKLGGASQNTDRRMKGVTQQSSNATKNFSKQAQTMQGGIVAVYATIAAQVFAVSAAFQFLKGSMEMRNLIEGQAAFGATTGVAYKSLTHDIQAATGGMIQFKEAAQAAAIGTAAGLSAGQLEQIGVAAKNTSLALGRDMTDSFNRLTRGITKAEPELLDELGIILRLEPALKAYATSIQKNVADLTQFEKSQAVANEVLGQAEAKFGSITKIMDPSAFALQQFAVAFDELVMKIQKGTAEFMIPIMQFASKNVYALVGALTLFLAPILKSILPDFAAMGVAASANYKIAATAAGEAADEAQRAKAALSGASGKGAEGLVDNDYMKKNKIKGADGKIGGQMSQRQINMRKKHLQAGTGFAKNMNKRQLADYRRFLTDQDIALNASLGKRQGFITRQQYRARALYAGTTAFYKKTQMQMVAVTKMASRAMNGAMKLMGWIGIALMIFEAVKALYTWIKGVDEAAEAEKKLAEGIKERYTGLTSEIGNMIEVQRAGLLGFRGTIEQIGSAFGSVDIAKVLADYNKALTIKDPEAQEAALAGITSSLQGLSDLSGAPKELKDVMELVGGKKKISTGKGSMGEAVLDLGKRMQAGAAASKNFSQANKALSQSLQQLAGSAAKLPFSGQIENLKTMTDNSTSMLAMGSLAVGTADTGVDAAKAKLAEVQANKTKQARAEAMRAAQKAFRAKTGNASSKTYNDNNALLEKQFGMSQGDMSRSLRGQGLGDLDEAGAQKALNDALQTQVEANDQEKLYTDEQVKQIALMKKMKGFQNTSMEISLKNLSIQTQLASRGMQSDAVTKNTFNNIKNEKAINNQKQKQLDLEMALTAEKAITDDSSPQQKKSAAFLVEQKREMLKTSKAQTTQTALEVKFGNLANTQAERRLRLTEEHALETAKTATSAAERKRLMDLTAGKFAKNVLAQKQVLDMEEKHTQLLEKEKNARLDLAEFIAIEGHDKEKAVQMEAAITKSVEDQLKLRQEIMALQSKQAGSLLAAARADKIVNQGANVSNMTGGAPGMLPGFGVDNITPQSKLLNQSLNAEGLTAAQAALQEVSILQDGVVVQRNKLEVMKEQADAQAGLNIELDLANKTSDIMRGGFESLFQALLDGTQSFGDAMKGVMKQVLADLAAAYMTAAAMTALRAMGLPGLPAGRYGGIMSPSGKSFAYGGVASGPQSGYQATLHGNEAVIPLGNDKSIPVHLNGGGGQNTVNVTVNMSGGQGQTQTQGDGAMQGLGRSIGGLVQQHLQQEMRPGGLLNQQGTKGRG